MSDTYPRGGQGEHGTTPDPGEEPHKAAAMAGAEPDADADLAAGGGRDAEHESALAEALVVLCIDHLKEHGRLEKEDVLTAFNNATGSSVGPVRPETQARVWAEVRRRLEETEGVDLVAVGRAFFSSPATGEEGPIDNEIAAKYVVDGMADEDLSCEDEVAAGFAVVKPEGETD